MNKKQKDTLRSFVGKAPKLPVNLNEVREWEKSSSIAEDWKGTKMVVKEIKPIRPTKAVFEDEKDVQRISNYATQSQKTQSVGMDRMRDMMGDFKQKKKINE